MDFNSHVAYVLACGLGESEDYGAFEAVVRSVLNEYAPVKKKHIDQITRYCIRSTPRICTRPFSFQFLYK